ncbi:MAG: hypothetical protein A3H98_02360 [Bacteroidetes bacterium RIFCSPLOWO2_02_FULL_36_8]|nr:MAG: hypothetical protein A3H98_02360 [Bacteroidetes bacterium RIFCSPLOWO2_02_FULL_36_8]OFY69166.1 MAG: hypothetical protein A3G23_06360 [Bacteroidetes bacterium RIFCSPLOWO2_12_FULL_37_12]
MSIAIRIKDCIDNHDKYVKILATKSDKELAKRINLVHIQMELADKAKNTGSLELLEIWRTQIIEARIYKAENNIADVPSEIELAIADIETFTAKAKERQEIVNEAHNPIKKTKVKVYQPKADDSQLSLF